MAKALNDAGPFGHSAVGLLKAEQNCMRGMLRMKTTLQDKGYLNIINHFHLTNCLSFIRASGLELRRRKVTCLQQWART